MQTRCPHLALAIIASVCLFVWCLTALSAQQGYIVPQESSVLRQLWWDDQDEDEQLKQLKDTKNIMKKPNQFIWTVLSWGNL